MSTSRGREVAHRLFAAEYDDADLEYAESDEERAPNYVVTPTGARANRAFVAGVLTEITPVGDDEVLRARVADPTGAFVCYAGQYQPEALAVIEEAEPPAFLAVTGKARTFQPDDGDRTFTSLRPETITHVDADVRDHHVVTAAERTIERVDTMALALQSGLTADDLRSALETAGLDAPRADGIALAIEHYEPSPAYLAALRDRAEQALAVVAGERDEVDALDLAPAANPEERSASDLSTAFAAVEGPLEAPAADPDQAVTPETAATDAESPADTAEPASSDASAATASSAAEDGDDGSEATPEAEAATTATDSSEEALDGESETEQTSPSTPAAEEETSEPAAEEATAEPAAEESDEGPLTEETTPEPATEETTAGPTTEETAGESATEETTAESSEDESASESSEDVEGFELDEDQREAIESEFPTDFETGNNVEAAGEADIDVPDPDELADAEAPATESGAPSAESETTESSSEPPGEESSAADDEDGDAGHDEAGLEDAVVERMGALDEGDGVERETLIAAVVDETGADPESVDDAIDDALMDGRCYAPGDETLKPI